MEAGSEAIFGLIGVVVGGLIATVGTIWAQWMQTRATVSAEVRAREVAASSTVIDVLVQLLQLPDEPPEDQNPDAATTPWHARRQQLLLTLSTSAQDLRQDKLRDRLDEVHRLLSLAQAAWNLAGQTEPQTRQIACRHALDCVGAFRRRAALPDRPDDFTATATMIDEWTSRAVTPRSR